MYVHIVPITFGTTFSESLKYHIKTIRKFLKMIQLSGNW
jgi:hypothetical protein